MANQGRPQNSGEGDADLLPQLQAEKDSLDPSFMHASKLLDKEIERVKSGRPETADKKYIEAHTLNPTKVSVKVLLPVKDHPKYNFVGKLLGPGGATMKKLQQELNCRMAIMGKGSMKDKRKEEELRKGTDPKHRHLNDELHLNIEAFAPMGEAYERIGNALKEIQPYLVPERDDGAMGMPPEMGRNPYENGGRGMMEPGRGPPPPRGQVPPLVDRGYREDPYYDAPAPAARPGAYDDYRQPPARDPYERPPVRGEYDRMPPAGAAPRAPRGEGFYDYGHSSTAPAAPRDRYDDYDARGWGGQQASGAPAYKAPPYKSQAPRGRGQGDRPHPYGGQGRGAPRY